MHKIYLALDLGTKTGWAVRRADGQIKHGVWSFAPAKHHRFGFRYFRFLAALSDTRAALGRIDGIIYEKVQFAPERGGLYAAQRWAGFEAILLAWCEREEVPYEDIHTGTLKKAATGNGRADKDAMIAAMRALGLNPVDDNDADALAMLMHKIGGPSNA